MLVGILCTFIVNNFLFSLLLITEHEIGDIHKITPDSIRSLSYKEDNRMHFQTSLLFENCIVVYASWGQIQKLRSVSQRNFMFKTKKTNAKDVVLHFDLNLSSTCRNEEESGKKFVWYTKVGPWDAILNMKLDIFRLCQLHFRPEFLSEFCSHLLFPKRKGNLCQQTR